MSEKIDELIDEIEVLAWDKGTCAEWGTGTAKAERELNEAKQALRSEIASLEAVVQAAGKYIGDWVDESAWQELVSAVREYQERE